MYAEREEVWSKGYVPYKIDICPGGQGVKVNIGVMLYGRYLKEHLVSTCLYTIFIIYVLDNTMEPI